MVVADRAFRLLGKPIHLNVEYTSLCTCKHLCICISVFVYKYMYLYIYAGMCVFMHVCVCLYVHICLVCVYVCMRVYIYMYMYMYMSMSMYICKCTCIYVYKVSTCDQINHTIVSNHGHPSMTREKKLFCCRNAVFSSRFALPRANRLEKHSTLSKLLTQSCPLLSNALGEIEGQLFWEPSPCLILNIKRFPKKLTLDFA